jgi:hypothetical protein
MKSDVLLSEQGVNYHITKNKWGQGKITYLPSELCVLTILLGLFPWASPLA